MDDRGTFLPPALARLVESKAQAHTLEHELFQLFLRGRRRITLGLGSGVDLPLLPEELAGAGLAGDLPGGRALVVATLRADPEGYTVERPVTNFGLFVRNPSTGNWINVPQGGEQRNLVPGDVIGLGSTPADCVKVTLPEGPWISTGTLPRSARHAMLGAPALDGNLGRPSFRLPEDEAKVTPDTPPTVGPHRHYTPRSPPMDRPRTNPGAKVTPPGANRSGPMPSGAMPPLGAPNRSDRLETPRPAPRAPDPRDQTAPLGASSKLPSREYEPLFRAALLHWRYAMVTFGGDPKSVIHLPDPSLARLRAALMRNCDQPERGYELFVKDPDPELWVEPRGEPMVRVQKGGAVKLRGPGNKLGFGRFVLELPAPAVVTPRFGPRVVPTPQDIADVLGLTVADLADADAVKARHRELARRFHPDRAGAGGGPPDPGPTSRFVEIQAAFDAWKAR